METILPSKWDLPTEIRSRVGHSVGRQRSMAAKGHLLILLHSPPRADEEQREPCLFWRDPGHTWRSNKFGTGTNALGQYLEGYEKATDDLQRRVPDEQSAQKLFEAMNELGPLHRSARNTHAALQQARELMADDTDIIDFRDHAEQIERTLELLRHEAKNALDYRVAAQTDTASRANAGRADTRTG